MASYDVSQIIIAIPSATPKQLADIYVKCRGAGVPVKMAPSITDLIRDSGSPASFRDLEITDLLDRLAVFRDLPPDRKSAELDEHMATLLPDAWIVSHQDARLPNAR